jgi:hypothetical protein
MFRAAARRPRRRRFTQRIDSDDGPSSASSPSSLYRLVGGIARVPYQRQAHDLKPMTLVLSLLGVAAFTPTLVDRLGGRVVRDHHKVSIEAPA